MKGFLTALAIAIGLCGCATIGRPASDYLSLQVDSYNPVSGEFKLTLRNDALRDVMFLHYLVAFSADRPATPVPVPAFPPDDTVMLHNTRLEPGETFQISGKCSSNGACKPGVHAGIYACWFNSRWECEDYVRVWSGSALNGA